MTDQEFQTAVLQNFQKLGERLEKQDQRLEKQDLRFEKQDQKLEAFRIEIKMDNAQNFDRIDRRFSEQTTEMNRRSDESNQHFKEVKYDLRLDKEKLEKVYESRDRVTVSFSRAFAGVNFDRSHALRGNAALDALRPE